MGAVAGLQGQRQQPGLPMAQQGCGGQMCVFLCVPGSGAGVVFFQGTRGHLGSILGLAGSCVLGVSGTDSPVSLL